jgi:hypothetical protein
MFATVELKKLNILFSDDVGTGKRILLKRIFKKYNGGVEWLRLAQNRDKLRDLVNMVTNLVSVK